MNLIFHFNILFTVKQMWETGMVRNIFEVRRSLYVNLIKVKRFYFSPSQHIKKNIPLKKQYKCVSQANVYANLKGFFFLFKCFFVCWVIYVNTYKGILDSVIYTHIVI